MRLHCKVSQSFSKFEEESPHPSPFVTFRMIPLKIVKWNKNAGHPCTPLDDGPKSRFSGKKEKKKKKNSFRKTPRKTKRGSSFFFLFLFCYLPQLHASLQGGKGIDVLLTRIVGSRGQGKVSDVFYESRLHNVEKSSWALEE